ncbi:fungal specific transcription factor domain-containing protein [Sarocladium implicatum]|nr:fungal specific transcription factor domain-containing protein [Sarocladium implicatum]
MAELPQQLMQKKARIRAFSHKSRGGCLTCKRRRKKCGEEKPTCLRCQQGGYVCDGYPCAPKSAKVLPRLAIKESPPSTLALTKVMVPGDSLETYYYVYFFTNALRDLEISPTINAGFWRKALHAPSQRDGRIRHAIMALGATHDKFVAPDSGASLAQHFALSHYNQAISELLQSKDPHEDASSQLNTVLTCCFLFVLIECLRGDFEEAMRHLEAGSRLILETKADTESPTKPMLELAPMFHALSSQLSLFVDDRIFPDLTGLVMPMKKYPMPVGKLRDLDEAEDVMNSFDDVLMSMDNFEECSEECDKIWNDLQEQMKSWNEEFQALLLNAPPTDQDDSEYRRIINLRTQYKLWQLLFEEDCEDDDHECGGPTATISPAECNVMLDEIEYLWRGTDTTRPQFGLKTDLITALFQLYVYCPDETVQRRIITLLRSRHRREIAWDSVELARYLEMHESQRMAGLVRKRWPNIGPSYESDALLVFRPKVVGSV